MKKNIAFIGCDLKLCDEAAQKFSDCTDRYFLSIEGLCCYYACKPSKQDVVNLLGIDLFNKFFAKAISDAIEYENTTLSINVLDMDILWLEKLKQSAVMILLGNSKAELLKLGADKQGYVRQRYKKFYDIYINADKKSADMVVNETFALIKRFTSEE